MQRREFLWAGASAGTLITVTATLVPACGGSKDDSGTDGAGTNTTDPNDNGGGSCIVGEAFADDAEGHGHTLQVPAAHLAQPTDRNYQSRGGDHTHTIQVSAANLQTLAETCNVTISSNDTHAHTWALEVA